MQTPRQAAHRATLVGMIDVLNLALPYFGLIFIGFACGKFKQIPDTALGWMNFFIVYVALPALFYRILSRTPLSQLAQVEFILATTLGTRWPSPLLSCIGLWIRSGRIDEATIAGLAGGYGNIGYMGPGLALATHRPAGCGADRADLLFRHAAAVFAGAVSDGAFGARLDERVADRARGHQADRPASAGHCDRGRRVVGGDRISAAHRARDACCNSCRTPPRPARCLRSASPSPCGRCSAFRGTCRSPH